MKEPGMRYVLTGFTHSTGVRVFAFDGVTDQGVRAAYRVRADVALARKHGIQMQELPLLCRAVLDRQPEGDDQRVFTFTEDDMTVHANAVQAGGGVQEQALAQTSRSCGKRLRFAHSADIEPFGQNKTRQK